MKKTLFFKWLFDCLCQEYNTTSLRGLVRRSISCTLLTVTGLLTTTAAIGTGKFNYSSASSVDTVPGPASLVDHGTLSDMKEVITAKDYSLLPIDPARTITIDCDEGSFMDVDISPDGNTILFTLLGELFIVPSTGGNATQLTRGVGVNYRPVWSSDGKYIAYVSDGSGERHLNVRNLKGNYHKLLGRNDHTLFYDYYPPIERQFEPIWLPGDDNIISGLYIYHLTGFKTLLPDPLIELDQRYRHYASANYNTIIGVTNDKKYIYFEDIFEDIKFIKRYDRELGTVENVVINSDEEGGQNNIGIDNNVRISPNGQWLVYMKKSNNNCNSDSLMVYEPKTEIKRSLTSLQTKSPGRIYEQHYSFSADSKFIFISFGGKIHRIDIQSGDDLAIEFNAKVNVDLGPLTYNKFHLSYDSLDVKYTRSANANNDGTKLVFSALKKIYIKDLHDGKVKLLVDQAGGQYYPVFSPDGNWITYASYHNNKVGHVWIVPAKGGEPIQITTIEGAYRNPSWSPDGKDIVVVKGDASPGALNSGNKGEIQVLSVAERTLQVIADKVPLHNRPLFSTNGTKIFFVPYQKGDGSKSPKFAFVDLVDKNRTLHIIAEGGSLSGSSLNSFSQQVIISPDERYLVYMYRDDLYLASLIKLGRPILIHDTTLTSVRDFPVIRFAKGGWDPHWENGGKVLSWSFGNQYFRVNPEKIIEASLKSNHEGALKDSRLAFAPTNLIDIPVEPDDVVNIGFKHAPYYAHGTLALANARILTMGIAKVIENGTLVIRNGRIVFVGYSNHARIPSNAKIIDLKGKTIIPGLIDLHVHAGPNSDVFPDVHENWLASLAYGVTTVRDPTGGIEYFGFSELTTTGKTIGPRVFPVGHAINESLDNINITSLESAEFVVNSLKRVGAISIKQYTLASRLQKQWLQIACRKARLNMTNEGGRMPLEYIAMIKNGSPGIEHIPIFGDFFKDIVSFLAASGTTITPTLQATIIGTDAQGKHYFRRQYSLPTSKMRAFFQSNSDQMEAFYSKYYKSLDSINPISCSGFLQSCKLVAAIKKAGGKLGLGSHSEDLGIGAHFEIWALQMGGLSNYEALEIATISSAEALGLQEDLGSIEVGKIADLVILDENPLQDIRNSTKIKYVVKDGIVYDGSSLNTVWPFKKNLRKGVIINSK